MDFNVTENSIFAHIARRVLKTNAVAMVIGKTIHLSGVSREEFLKDKRWVKHELVHIEQYKRYGKLRFLFLYLMESVRKGYYNNKYEVEAREKSR